MVLSLSDRCELAFRTRSHRCITSSSGSSSTKNWETSSTTNITQQQLSQPHKSSELSSNAPTISHDGTIAYSNGVLVSPKSSTIDEKLFSKAVAYVMKKVKDPEKVYDAFLDYFKKLYQEMNNKSVHQPPLLVEEPVKDDGTALLAIMEDGTTPCNNIRDDVNVSSDVNLTMISLNAYISFILIHLFKKILVTEPEDVVSFCMNTLGSPKFQMLISEFFMKQQDKYNVGSKVLDCNTVLPEMNLVILIIGIQNSGKTTLVSLIKGARRGENTKSIVNAISTRPTMGVIPINMSYGKQVKIKFLDVGGHVQFRGVWENYYHSVHSIIFVIDASSPEETFQEAVSVSKQSFGHRFIQGKPILVFCNKMDIHGRRSPEDISSHMNLNVRVDGNVRVVATSFNPSSSSHHDDADNTCNSNIGAAAGSNNTSSCQMINSSHTYTKYPSSMVEHSIEWLLKKTLSNYQEINDRVLEDTQIVNSQRIKKRVSETLS
jgi:small GTP-binding protein domain